MRVKSRHNSSAPRRKGTFHNMNAYLFTGWFRWMQNQESYSKYGRSNRIQTLDSCFSMIVYAGTAEAGQARFEAWLLTPNEAENTGPRKIEKVVGTRFVDQLFTESGSVPIDWAQIAGQADAAVQATTADDSEHRYWADVNQLVRPKKLSPDIESLRKSLPDDVCSGLNWSEQKKFFFVLSVLSPPPPPSELLDEQQVESSEPEEPQDDAW